VVEKQGKPSLWLPFGVDTGTFRQTTPYHARRPRAYFRGKTRGWTAWNEYALRTRLLTRVVAEDLVDVIDYQNQPLPPQTLVDEFNQYQIAVNFPSVFSSHPTRVAEGMACGCLMITNRTGIPAVDSMFEDNRHLIYYNDADELVACLENSVRDEKRCADIAVAGKAHVVREYSLAKQLATILRTLT
jgi:spore maturation protein CgeB